MNFLATNVVCLYYPEILESTVNARLLFFPIPPELATLTSWAGRVHFSFFVQVTTLLTPCGHFFSSINFGFKIGSWFDMQTLFAQLKALFYTFFCCFSFSFFSWPPGTFSTCRTTFEFCIMSFLTWFSVTNFHYKTLSEHYSRPMNCFICNLDIDRYHVVWMPDRASSHKVFPICFFCCDKLCVAFRPRLLQRLRERELFGSGVWAYHSVPKWIACRMTFLER